MRLCKLCGRWIYDEEVRLLGPHKCPPVFHVWMTSDGDRDDAVTVYASDAETAAVDYLENHYHEGKLGPHEVAVVDSSGAQTLWTVEGELAITWRAEARGGGR